MPNFGFQIYTNCQVIKAVPAEGILHNWTLSQLDTFTTGHFHNSTTLVLYYRQVPEPLVLKTPGFKGRWAWPVVKPVCFITLPGVSRINLFSIQGITQERRRQAPPGITLGTAVTSQHRGALTGSAWAMCGAPGKPSLEYMMTEATRLCWRRSLHIHGNTLHIYWQALTQTVIGANYINMSSLTIWKLQHHSDPEYFLNWFISPSTYKLLQPCCSPQSARSLKQELWDKCELHSSCYKCAFPEIWQKWQLVCLTISLLIM